MGVGRAVEGLNSHSRGAHPLRGQGPLGLHPPPPALVDVCHMWVSLMPWLYAPIPLVSVPPPPPPVTIGAAGGWISSSPPLSWGKAGHFQTRMLSRKPRQSDQQSKRLSKA